MTPTNKSALNESNSSPLNWSSPPAQSPDPWHNPYRLSQQLLSAGDFHSLLSHITFFFHCHAFFLRLDTYERHCVVFVTSSNAMLITLGVALLPSTRAIITIWFWTRIFSHTVYCSGSRDFFEHNAQESHSIFHLCFSFSVQLWNCCPPPHSLVFSHTSFRKTSHVLHSQNFIILFHYLYVEIETFHHLPLFPQAKWEAYVTNNNECQLLSFSSIMLFSTRLYAWH